jgi:uncharacterized lipoprotein NlpE involved in copper resistance
MKAMKNILFLVVFTLFLTGCNNKQEYFNSTHNIKIQEGIDYKIMADDMFSFVSQYFAPNKTIFYISTNESDKSLYNYLTQKFREKGYAVTTDSVSENIVFLSYKIQEEPNNLILVTYFINESKISRAYILKDNKLLSAGEITAFNFDKQALTN